jgi:ribonuclease HI
MSKLVIYTDGGARGNPGPAAAGVVIKENGNTLLEFGQYLGPKETNNYAEYQAVILALEALKREGCAGRALDFKMDSKLVVEQVQGNWKIKEPSLKPLVAKIHDLLKDFPQHSFAHIPRAENAEADALVNDALDAQL